MRADIVRREPFRCGTGGKEKNDKKRNSVRRALRKNEGRARIGGAGGLRGTRSHGAPPFVQGGERCYDAFTDVIDTLTFASDLEIVESGAGGVTADRDTDAFVLEAWVDVRANLCPAASCSVQFASFMNKDLLCGSHITDTDIHLSPAQREYLNAPAVSGSYFGTGSSARAFSTGFSPRAVFVAAQGMPPALYDASTGVTEVYSAFACGQGNTPGLSITANGFTVGSAAAGTYNARLNETGRDYFYLAFRG